MVKKIFLISAGSIAALFLVLVVHIAMVSGKPADHKADLQLARIDLQAPIDAAQAAELRSAIQAMPGVDHCYINMKAGTLVYSYKRSEQNKEAVFAQVAEVSPVPCVAFEVSAADMANGCPVINKGSFQYKVGAWIKGLIG